VCISRHLLISGDEEACVLMSAFPSLTKLQCHPIGSVAEAAFKKSGVVVERIKKCVVEI
jgi:hypothetical protein